MSLLLPLALATILTKDPLGYDCVPEERLEIAFALEGKHTRAPRTCIPDPCKETFSEATLASYTGYRDEALYMDYRRRMSSVCGTPTAWEERGVTDEQLLWAVFDGGSGPIPLPLQAQAGATAADSANTLWANNDDDFFRLRGRGWDFPGGGGSSGGGTPVAPRPGGGDGPDGEPEFDETDAAPPEEVPIPAPLPAPLLLLGAAVAALGLLKRRKGARPPSAPAA